MTRIVASDSTTLAESTRRKPGRPPSSKNNKISRASIIRTALKLAKTVPLQELSIVLVAKTMDVTPALIHYYVGGRDWLTSGVMNLFYKELIKKWPESEVDPESSILSAANAIYEHLIKYSGIASYMVLNNKFRIFQLTAENERDYGVELLERFTSEVMKAGCSAERTGIYSHLMMDFIIGSAHGAVIHRYPGEHRQFLEERTSKLDPALFPSIHFTRATPLNLDASAAFREGCRLFLLGLRSEQLPAPPSACARDSVATAARR